VAPPCRIGPARYVQLEWAVAPRPIGSPLSAHMHSSRKRSLRIGPAWELTGTATVRNSEAATGAAPGTATPHAQEPGRLHQYRRKRGIGIQLCADGIGANSAPEVALQSTAVRPTDAPLSVATPLPMNRPPNTIRKSGLSSTTL
jgi:hypothetical protein